MGRTNRGFATAISSRHRPDPAEPAPGRERREDRLDPATRAANRALRGAEYGRFAAEVRRDLDPRGPLEDLVARHAIRSAWRLKADLERAGAAEGADIGAEGDQAACSLEVAITTLDLLQGRRAEAPSADASATATATATETDAPESGPFAWVGDDDADRPAAESNEWPVVPEVGPGIEDEGDEDDAPSWRGRLVYDFDVSDRSPVVKGTWITVSYVVSLIVDGATWAEILRTHPELTEADIRTCVAYAVTEEDPLP